jgi:hypothetical protein
VLHVYRLLAAAAAIVAAVLTVADTLPGGHL